MTSTAELLPPLTEKQFQAQVIQLAKLLGWKVYHPFLSKWSERGFPDLTMVRGMHLIFAELKTEKGQPTAAQTEWLDALYDVYGYVETFLWRPSDWPEIERVLR